MSRTDTRTLISRGRKAGLNTGELYRALSATHPEGSDGQTGQADGNGYVSDVDAQGHLIHRPVDSSRS